eukprot:m.1376315 g.1376315  ORF g.1376315 m.1376315 type:complete len:249 (-) comp24963_c0_seq15:2018-2764(-)
MAVHGTLHCAAATSPTTARNRRLTGVSDEDSARIRAIVRATIAKQQNETRAHDSRLHSAKNSLEAPITYPEGSRQSTSPGLQAIHVGTVREKFAFFEDTATRLRTASEIEQHQLVGRRQGPGRIDAERRSRKMASIVVQETRRASMSGASSVSPPRRTSLSARVGSQSPSGATSGSPGPSLGSPPPPLSPGIVEAIPEAAPVPALTDRAVQPEYATRSGCDMFSVELQCCTVLHCLRCRQVVAPGLGI